MTELAISNSDIQDLFAVLSAAIELDQMRVDALPPEKFHPFYDDGMWRRWRNEHLEYIGRLLPTCDAIPATTLEKLTWLALNYEPAVINRMVLEILAHVASGDYAREELTTAARFLDRLISQVARKGKPIAGDARDMMMRWMPVTDPLRIAEDPECGYCLAARFLS